MQGERRLPEQGGGFQRADLGVVQADVAAADRVIAQDPGGFQASLLKPRQRELLPFSQADDQQALGPDTLWVVDHRGLARLGRNVAAVAQRRDQAVAGFVHGPGRARDRAVLGDGDDQAFRADFTWLFVVDFELHSCVP